MKCDVWRVGRSGKMKNKNNFLFFLVRKTHAQLLGSCGETWALAIHQPQVVSVALTKMESSLRNSAYHIYAHIFLKTFRYGWTYRCPADLAEPPCWMLRAPCMLHGGKGTLPSQRGRHRRDPFRWGCSGGMRTGSCAERSTAAVPGRNPASRGARSDRYRSPYLWRRTPAWSGNPWKPRWNHRPRGWRASSPRRQVRTARSFSGVYLAVVVSDRVCSELRSSTVWKLLTQSEACVSKLPWRSSQAVHRGGAQPN